MNSLIGWRARSDPNISTPKIPANIQHLKRNLRSEIRMLSFIGTVPDRRDQMFIRNLIPCQPGEQLCHGGFREQIRQVAVKNAGWPGKIDFCPREHWVWQL